MSLDETLSGYWSRGLRRRRFIGAGLALSGSAAFLAACSSSNNNTSSNAPAANNTAANNTAANKAAPATVAGTARANGGTAIPGGSPVPGAAQSFRPSTTGVKAGGNYTACFIGPFAGVDPHNSVYGGAGIVPQVYDYLVRVSLLAPDQGVIPQLATKYEQMSDQVTTVFTLRPNAMIAQNSQGVPVRAITSADVKASFDRILDPKVASNGFAWVNTWVDHYDTPDANTFRIVTKKPYAWLLYGCGYNLQTAIVPQEWLQNANVKTQAVGSGPFTLTSLTEGDSAVMTKNPAYWDTGHPYLNTYTIKSFQDLTTWRTAFGSGQVDQYAPQNVDEGKDLAGQVKGSQFFTDSGFGYDSFWQNTTMAPWSDARLRRAVWRAVNPAEYISIIGHNDSVHIGLETYAMGQYALPEATLNQLAPFDVQQSKQLLAAAGQPNLNFTFTFPTSGNVQDYVTIFVKQMAAAGITAKPDPQDPATWVANYFQSKLSASLSLNQEYATPDIPMLWYRTGGITGNNHYDTGFKDPDVDTAIDKAASTLDEQARIQAYQDAQKLVISKDPPFWNFMGNKTYNVYQPAIQNVPHGVGTNFAYYYLKDIWANR